MPSTGLSWFSSLFLDSTPSVLAAVAIFVTIGLFVATLFVAGGSATVGQKLGASFVLFLVLLPSIGLSLFDITCLMRGGDEGLCFVLGWVKAIIILVYMSLIAITTITILYYGKDLKYAGFTDAPASGKAADDVPGLDGRYLTPLEKEQFTDLKVKSTPPAMDASGNPVAVKKAMPMPKKPAAAAAAEPFDSMTPAASIAGALSDATGLGALMAQSKKEAFFGGKLDAIANMSSLTAGLTPLNA